MGKNMWQYRKDASECHHSSFQTNLRPLGGNLCEKNSSVFTKTLLAATSCQGGAQTEKWHPKNSDWTADHVTETLPLRVTT